MALGGIIPYQVENAKQGAFNSRVLTEAGFDHARSANFSDAVDRLLEDRRTGALARKLEV